MTGLLLALLGCDRDTDCLDDTTQFRDEVKPLVEGDCASCHSPEGIAADTRNVWVEGEDNEAMLRGLATEIAGDQSVLLAKALGDLDHGGGARVTEGGDDWAALEEFVARSFAPGGCEHPGAPELSCEGAGRQPGTTPLRRLTDRQANQAAYDLLGVEVEPGLFPVTIADGGMTTWPSSNTVSGAGAMGILSFAEAAAEAADVSACSSDEAGLEWSTDFVQAAYRRPLSKGTSDRIAAVLALGEDPEAGCRAVIEFALQSPYFLYLGLEADDTEGVSDLDDFAVAERLSFFLWNTTPDEELIAAARAGELSTRAGVREQARRMVDDPRSAEMVVRFHSDWLQLERLDEVTKDAELYPDWQASTLEMSRHETELFVSEVVWLGEGRFDTLLDSRTTWLTPELGEIYGLDLEGGWQRAELDDARPGVLTRSAWLAGHGYANTSAPVRRGAFLLEQLYCEDLTPPADVDFDLPEEVEGESVRDRLAQHRDDPVCAPCHDRIDPAGFAFEHYGPVGEWREVWEDGLEVDATGELDGLDFDDAVGLLDTLDRERARACYTKRWFEYAVGRPSETVDACALEELEARFAASDGDLRELVVAITQSDAFLTIETGP